jgi:hypothetical protein
MLRAMAGSSSVFAIIFALISASAATGTTYNCTTFSVPGGQAEFRGFNNAGLMSGFYTASGTSHGFRQDSAGNYTAIDYPGATSTQLFATNNNGVTVGQYNIGSTAAFFTLDAAGNFKQITPPAGYTLFPCLWDQR